MISIHFYVALPQALSFPSLGVGMFSFGFWQNSVSEIQLPLLGCSVFTSGKGEVKDHKADMPVTPAGLLSLVPGGCWVSVGRARVTARQHVPELSPPSHPVPGFWENDILCVSRKQLLSLESQSLHKSLFAKASWPFLTPAGCSPLATSLLLHRGGRAQPHTPNSQKLSTGLSLFRKEKQQQEH